MRGEMIMHDLIVIGEDLSSYVAAAMAQRYGVNTALIAGNDYCGSCRIGGFTFNLDPLPATGFGVNQTCLALLAELDIPVLERNCLLLNPAFQVILPRHRIDIFNEIEPLVAELVREFPEDENEIYNIYSAVYKYTPLFEHWFRSHPFVQPSSFKDAYHYLELLPYYFKQKLITGKLKKFLARNTSLHRVFEAQLAMLSCLENQLNAFSSFYLFAAPLRGVYYFQGGIQVFYKAILKSFLNTGGTYLTDSDIKNINNDRIAKVEVLREDGTLAAMPAKNLIISNKSEAFNLVFKGEKKFISISDWLRPAKIKYLPFTIHLGIPEKCLPEKMSRHVAVICNENKNIHDNNMIILAASMPEDEALAPKDKIALTATVFLPADTESWSEESLQATALSILDNLEFFLPFLKENIEILDIEKSIALSRKQKEVVSPKYQLKSSFITGFSAANNKTRYKNVYLSGASLFGDNGFEGEIISGMNAASCVIGKAK